MSPIDILLVEDNLLNQRLLVRQLAHLGVQDVDLVSNGAEALDWLARRSCRLILADCQMPGMDGYEMARRIRQREACTNAARLPILALTASALDLDKQVCLAAGMDDHIAKPASIDALRRALRPWLGARISDERPAR